VDLTDPILSRFDLLTVIRDNSNEAIDDALATFVLNSHMKSHPKIRELHTGSGDQENYQMIMDSLKNNMLPESNVKKNDSLN
jgi:DNA replication licensing factor MCM2